MRHIFSLLLITIFFTACSTKSIYVEKNKVKKLSLDIQSLSHKIDKDEAKEVAYEVIIYSKQLAKRYEVTTPALFHNTLINLNIKKRGYCYHYANDLQKYLKTKKFKSFKFIRAVSKRGQYFEHSSLVLTRDDLSFENSLILDAWRDTGELFWSKVKDDKEYIWEKK